MHLHWAGSGIDELWSPRGGCSGSPYHLICGALDREPACRGRHPRPLPLLQWNKCLKSRQAAAHKPPTQEVLAHLWLAMMPTMPGSAARRCSSFRASLGGGVRPGRCQASYLSYV